VGHRTGKVVVKRVNNICTQLANSLSAPKCDTLRVLQKAEYDIKQLLQVRTDLSNTQRVTLERLVAATVAVYSCKAVLEKKVGALALCLTSSLRGLESHLLNFEHVETDLEQTIKVFNMTYFEARYGDYMFSSSSRVDMDRFSLRPCSTTDFMDPDELAKTANFDALSRRLADDTVAIEGDLEKLPSELQENIECCASIDKAMNAYRNRYFSSVNRITGSYQLSEYGERLLEEKELRDKEMADEAMDDESGEDPVPSQPLEEYDILDDEIYMSDGVSRSTSDDDKVNTASETSSNTSSDGEQ
jgi:hypothetical protein